MKTKQTDETNKSETQKSNSRNMSYSCGPPSKWL